MERMQEKTLVIGARRLCGRGRRVEEPWCEISRSVLYWTVLECNETPILLSGYREKHKISQCGSITAVSCSEIPRSRETKVEYTITVGFSAPAQILIHAA